MFVELSYTNVELPIYYCISIIMRETNQCTYQSIKRNSLLIWQHKYVFLFELYIFTIQGIYPDISNHLNLSPPAPTNHNQF